MLQLLVVDDDHATRETYAAALRHAGFGVTLAHSGCVAIAALSCGAKTDAVLLDLKLGDMTGYDVLRWMQAQTTVVPTAVMTAFRIEFDPDEAIALGAVAYADQPLPIDDLVALAESLTMPPSPRDPPLQLHSRLLAGQPGALECLDSVFLQALPKRLGSAFPRAPWDFTVDAVMDACLEYGANPAKFDPSRHSSIVEFVYLIARRNLADRLRAESTRKNRELRYAREQTVVLPPDPDRGRSDIDVWAAVSTVTIDSRERRAVELWLDGAGNDGIADALGVGHLCAGERQREVKRFKDRLVKRLSRYVRPLPGRA
jgi:CheY-like chemotaxis protein